MPKTATAAPQPIAQATPAYPMHYDVRIYPVKTDGKLRANASVNINDAFAIKNVRVLEGPNGLFVSMPQFKGNNGEWKDICFPCTADSSREFNGAVLDAYQQKLEQMQAEAQQQEAEAQQQEAEAQQQEAPTPEQGPVMSM